MTDPIVAATAAQSKTQTVLSQKVQTESRQSLPETRRATRESASPLTKNTTRSLTQNTRPTESRATGARGASKKQSSTEEEAQQIDADQENNRTRDKRSRKVQGPVQTEGEASKKQSIDALQFLGMLLVAIVLDAIQIIAGFLVFGIITSALSFIVSFLVNVAGWLIFGIWFAINGQSLFQGRRLAVSLIGFFADSILAGFVPNWTITVVVAYGEERLKAHGVNLGAIVGKATK